MLSAIVLSVAMLTACGAAAPPAEELALEMIDTLDLDEPVKVCMREKVAAFRLTDDQAVGFKDLDDVAGKAADGNQLAQDIIDDLERALARCL